MTLAKRNLDNVFGDMFRGTVWDNRDYFPVKLETNVVEDEDKYVIEMKVPGLEEKDIDISIEKDILKIAHTNKRECESKLWSMSGINSFEKTFCLNSTIDKNKIDAQLKNGLLVVSLHKREEEKPIVIKVN